MVGFVLDLIERKRAEAEARDSERRYREVQTELAHAGRVATMGQLTASIAHEVKQPIAGSVTNVQAALNWLNHSTPNLKEARHALNCAVNDGIRAAEVIDRIRELVRKAPPRKDRLEINGAIREVIELARGEAVKNRVSVQMQLAEGLPLIEADRVQLQQVILNLIINAIQAMTGTSDGLRELLIRTGKADPDGVLVAVRDWVPDWRLGRSNLSSSPSTRPSRTVWGWGFPFAARSSKRIGGDCGPARTCLAAPTFNSRCQPAPIALRDACSRNLG